MLGSIFFPPLKNSINKKNNLPPSKAGIGSKFKTPKFKLITAAKYNTLIIPVLVASATILITPIGPASD